MNKRGPKPTPTATLNLRGSWRGKARKDEPQPVGTPVKPSFIKGKAKKKWQELLEELTRLGVVGSADSTTLARYCQLWEIYQQLITEVGEEGFVTTSINKKGDEYVSQNPKVNAFIKIAGLLARLEDCFGLSPAARAGLKVNGKAPEESDLEKLMRERGIKVSGA
jgi:P27 family predicted phage terminase small subunit